MWPFKSRSAKARITRLAAEKDSASLGNLLLRLGMVTPEQLNEALDYQDSNPDHLLGETLVAMDVVDKEIIEAILAVQRLQREGGKKNLAEVIEIAKNRKKPLQDAHDRVVAAAMNLTVK